MSPYAHEKKERSGKLSTILVVIITITLVVPAIMCVISLTAGHIIPYMIMIVTITLAGIQTEMVTMFTVQVMRTVMVEQPGNGIISHSIFNLTRLDYTNGIQSTLLT